MYVIALLIFSDPVFRRTHMPFESSHRSLARNGLILAGLSALLVLAGCSNDDQPAQQGGGGMPPAAVVVETAELTDDRDRKSTRLNSSHVRISYAVFCL